MFLQDHYVQTQMRISDHLRHELSKMRDEIDSQQSLQAELAADFNLMVRPDPAPPEPPPDPDQLHDWNQRIE